MPPRKKTAPAAKKAAPAVPSVTPNPDPMETATPDVRQGVEKAAVAKAPKLGSPAERRADYLRALEEERGMCQRMGKDERVKAIEAEIKRAKSAVAGRSSGPSDEA